MATKRQLYHIGIVGSYGGLNLGDEAILQSIVQQIRASVKARITVFSRDAEDTRQRHAIDAAVSTRNLSRDELAQLIEPLDLLILGGGILFDAEARVFLRETIIAHELRVPFMVYAIGAGPLQDPAAQEAVRDCLDGAAIITVREAAARQALEEAGVRREIVVTADPALLLRPEPMPSVALPAEAVEWKGRWSGCRCVSRAARHRISARRSTISCSPTRPTSWWTVTARKSCSCRWSAASSTCSTAMPSSHACCGRSAPQCSRANTRRAN